MLLTVVSLTFLYPEYSIFRTHLDAAVATGAFVVVDNEILADRFDRTIFDAKLTLDAVVLINFDV